MVESADLSENMKVVTADGGELGTIIRVEERAVLVERGRSSLSDLRIPLALVTHVGEGAAHLALTRAEVERDRRSGGALGVGARTLREETFDFVHEGDEAGAGRGRTPDNLPEGGTAPGARER